MTMGNGRRRPWTDRTLTPVGARILGFFGAAFLTVAVLLLARACMRDERRLPPATAEPAPAPRRTITLTTPALAVVPAVDATPLALAMSRMPARCRPTVPAATALASMLEAHFDDYDLFMVAGLIRAESGFCAGAVERGGPGRGLLQLHVRYLPPGVDPFDPAQAIPAARVKLDAFLTWHRDRCDGAKPHDVLTHWFAGFSVEGNERAIVSAAKVRRYAEELRVLAGGV